MNLDRVQTHKVKVAGVVEANMNLYFFLVDEVSNSYDYITDLWKKKI